MSEIRIQIDNKKCIGCGLCATLDPKSFRINKKGKSEVIKKNGVITSKTKEAINSCPVNAISLKQV